MMQFHLYLGTLNFSDFKIVLSMYYYKMKIQIVSLAQS